MNEQTLLEGEEKWINHHWLVGRRDNFGKDQPPLVGGYRINLYWRQRKKGSTSTGWWGGGITSERINLSW
jgi:hypothetical protein